MSFKTMTLVQLTAFCLAHSLSISASDLADIFEEVRFKQDIQLGFSQFEEALVLISRKLYPNVGYESSYEKLKMNVVEVDAARVQSGQSSGGRYKMMTGEAANVPRSASQSSVKVRDCIDDRRPKFLEKSPQRCKR